MIATPIPIVKTSCFTLPHSKNPVELALIYFADRVWVTLTTNGKIGSLYHCQKASILPPFSESSSMVEQALLGAWTPLYAVFANEISQYIQPYYEVPVIVGLTFPELNQLDFPYQKEWLQGILQELDNVLKS